MAKFAGRRGDLTWGIYDYPVTLSQKNALEGIWWMWSGLPKAYQADGLPKGGFYSQNPKTGGVIMGLNHHSVTVHRSGRVTKNVPS